MVELGGNINLEGFDETDHSVLIMVKKMVGSYAKKISEEKGNFEKFTVKKDGDEISVTITKDKKDFIVSSKDKNLFFTLGEALKKVIKEVK